MIQPLTALLIGAAIFGLTGLLFWPESGWVWRLQRRRELTERVLMEDALKYMLKCERHQHTATGESLAGALSISQEKALDLVSQARSKGLIEFRGGKFQLTDAGRDTALQIVRAHRLWEKYLADATGFTEEEWHQRAERQEHLLSREQMNQLSARLGNPTHDPHGDPIPTPDGSLVSHGGIPLPDLEENTLAEIIHIEDEPDVVYAQITAEGLHPHQRLELEENTSTRVRFWSEGREFILAPIVAANLSVIPLELETQTETAGIPLAALPAGKKGKVLEISPRSRGVDRRRLLDLGVIPGTEIEVVMNSPGGNPTAYRIRGSVIALRESQASLILVDPLTDRTDQQEPIYE